MSVPSRGRFGAKSVAGWMGLPLRDRFMFVQCTVYCLVHASCVSCVGCDRVVCYLHFFVYQLEVLCVHAWAWRVYAMRSLSAAPQTLFWGQWHANGEPARLIGKIRECCDREYRTTLRFLGNVGRWLECVVQYL